MANNNEVVTHRVYTANTATLTVIRGDLKAFLESLSFGVDCIEEIVIAVNEACMNIIQHADGGNYSGDITLTASATPARITIEVCDDAAFFDVNTVLNSERKKLSPGGLGLYFIRQIMDEIQSLPAADNGGNKLILTRSIGK